MPQQSHSGSSSYCTPADFLTYYDQRIILDLVSSTGSPANAGTITTNPVLLRHLETASGRVEASCAIGERYTTEDLAALSGNAAKFLTKLVADLAFKSLREFRGMNEASPPQCMEAEKTLERLSAGALIFPTIQSEKAGHVQNRFIQPLERQKLNLLSDTRRYFGTRLSELPHG